MHKYLTVAVHAMHLPMLFRNAKLRSDSIKVLLQWKFFVKIKSQKKKTTEELTFFVKCLEKGPKNSNLK